MPFLELTNFENASKDLQRALYGNLLPAPLHAFGWSEWNPSLSEAPDATLINATQVDWRTLKKYIDRSSCSNIHLFGCHTKAMGLPVLLEISHLDKMLRGEITHKSEVKMHQGTFYANTKQSTTDWKMTVLASSGTFL